MKEGRTSKVVGKSSNRDGNNSEETPITEIKKKYTSWKKAVINLFVGSMTCLSSFGFFINVG